MMEGYPIVLNTKEDYLNMLEIDREETVNRLKRLLSSTFTWQYVRDLEDGEEGLEDDTHRVETWTENFRLLSYDEIPEEGKVTRSQFELRPSSNSELHRLGFTVEEVEKLISDNEAS